MYLHAGGPLDGCLKHVPAGMSTYSHAEATEVSLKEYDPATADWQDAFRTHTYERVSVSLFGKTVEVYVWRSKGADRNQLLFDVMVSSIAKAAMK